MITSSCGLTGGRRLVLFCFVCFSVSLIEGPRQLFPCCVHLDLASSADECEKSPGSQTETLTVQAELKCKAAHVAVISLPFNHSSTASVCVCSLA